MKYKIPLVSDIFIRECKLVSLHLHCQHNLHKQENLPRAIGEIETVLLNGPSPTLLDAYE